MGIVFTLILMAGCIGLAVWSMLRQMHWHDQALRLLYEFSPDLWTLMGQPLGFRWQPPEEIKSEFKNFFNQLNGIQVFKKDRPEFALIPGMQNARKNMQRYNKQAFLLMVLGILGVPVAAVLLSVHM